MMSCPDHNGPAPCPLPSALFLFRMFSGWSAGQASSSPQARQYSSRSASSSSTPACSARHAGSPADSAHLRQYSSGASPHSNPRSAAPQPSWQGSRGACASALADLQGRELPSPSRSGERARPQSSGRAAAPGQARGMSASAGGSSPLSTGLPSATSRPSPSSIMGMLRMVLHTEGVVGLYRGISPTILGILPYAGLKFYVYQSLKQVHSGSPPRAVSCCCVASVQGVPLQGYAGVARWPHCLRHMAAAGPRQHLAAGSDYCMSDLAHMWHSLSSRCSEVCLSSCRSTKAPTLDMKSCPSSRHWALVLSRG